MPSPQFIGAVLSQLVKAGNVTEWATTTDLTYTGTVGASRSFYLPIPDELTGANGVKMVDLVDIPIVEAKCLMSLNDGALVDSSYYKTLLLQGVTAYNVTGTVWKANLPLASAAATVPYRVLYRPSGLFAPNQAGQGQGQGNRLTIVWNVTHDTAVASPWTMSQIAARLIYIPKGA